MIARAAQSYGLIITDQNYYGVGFRFENYERQWADWSSDGRVLNPYTDPSYPNLKFFQCPNLPNYSCYPDGNSSFAPFSQIHAPNTQPSGRRSSR